jgi:acetate kinase
VRHAAIGREVNVLSVNAGSSSLKFALHADDTRIARGTIERIGGDGGRLRVEDGGGRSIVERPARVADAPAAVDVALDALASATLPRPDAAGHRLVHGGTEHVAPAIVDAALLTRLRALVPLAPLHLPGELACVDAVAARWPALPQVICFDTAFHRAMPEIAQRLPLPRRLWDRGIRRYGFHGLSYEYVVQTVGAERLGRAVIAHLGNGASMAAVRDGVAVDTTMGFSPTGGFMMGTRSGDLDPGVLIHLLRSGWDASALERLVDREAGLLGVSGTTSDMKELLARRSDDPRAAEAVAMFCAALRRWIGALAATLGGLDTLVFTGGIGERAAAVRAEACAGLAHLGVRLDATRNEAHADVVSAPDAACTVRVVATDEDVMIARHTRRALERRAGCRSA